MCIQGGVEKFVRQEKEKKEHLFTEGFKAEMPLFSLQRIKSSSYIYFLNLQKYELLREQLCDFEEFPFL